MQTYFGLPLGQQNLRSRVVCVALYNDFNSSTALDDYNDATYYPYDMLGNVKSLIYVNKALQAISHKIKKIEFDFDLISSKLNRVFYQKGQADQFSLGIGS